MIRNAHPTTSRPKRLAFTLVELLIVLLILGVLAALVIPSYSSATASARESNLVDNLRQIRTQLLVYAAQHDGVAPGYPNGDKSAAPDYDTFVAQMTGYSNTRGQVSTTASDAFPRGPYLRQIPVNPLSLTETVRMIGNHDSFPSAPSGSEGWIYQAATLTFVANTPGTDKSGRAYFDY